MPTPVIQKCALCLRGFKGVTLNGRSNNKRKMCNIFLDNLKPNLSEADSTLNFNWSCFQEGIPVLCRNCFQAGQRLERMKERLKEIETEIQCYVHQISTKILKHWQQSEILGPDQSERNSDQHFGYKAIGLKNITNEATGLNIANEDIGLDVANQVIHLNIMPNGDIVLNTANEEIDLNLNTTNDDNDHNIMANEDNDLNIENEDIDLNIENEDNDLNIENEDIDLNFENEDIDLNFENEDIDLNMTNEALDPNVTIGDIDLDMEKEYFILVNESDFPPDLATVSQNLQQQDDFEEPHPIEDVYFFPNSWDDEDDTHENITIPDQNNSEEDVSNKNSNSIDDLLSQIKSRRLFVSLERIQLDKNGQIIPKVPIKNKTEVEKLSAEDSPKRPQTTKRQEPLRRPQPPKRRCRTVYSKQKPKKFSKEKDEEKFSDTSSSSEKNYENCDSDGDFIPKKKYLNESRRSSSKTLKTQREKDNNKKYKCNQCGETFIKKYAKLSHMLQQHGDIPISCVHCYDRFKDILSLRDHLKVVHKEKCLICKSCPELSEFTNDYEYKVHCMSHNGEIPFECSKCHEKFASANNYCTHQKLSPCAISYGLFKCGKCEEAFKAKLLLFIHKVVCHNRIEPITTRNGPTLYCCDICGDGSRKMSLLDLESHYAEHTNEFLYSCDICGKGFQNTKKFSTHRKTHISYHCKLCDFTTHVPSSFSLHKKVTHSEMEKNECTCEECGKKFVGKHKLSKHMYHCGKKVFCEVCDKMIASGSLFIHNKYHHSDLPQQTCSICGKQFISLQALNQHRKTQHIKVSRYVCEICGKVLTAKQYYDNHMKKHEGGTHDCQICAEKFPTIYKLSKHRKEIHDIGDFSCRYCSEILITDAQRRYHEVSMHAEIVKKESKCGACGMTFKTAHLCRQHRRKMHKELITPRVNRTCEICNKVFAHGVALRRHLRNHERDKEGSFHCNLCERRFMKKLSLAYHLNHDHKNQIKS